MGSLGISDIRDVEGFEPMAVISLLAKLGTSDPVDAFETVEGLLDGFDLGKLSRSPARFDPEDLKRINAKLLHAKPYGEVKDRLAAMGADGGEAFWDGVRSNLERLSDAKALAALVSGPVTPVIADEDTEFAATAAAMLPAGQLDGTSWGNWTSALKETTGRKGKGLFMPLRLAPTGQAPGPATAVMLPLPRRERAAARLTGQEP